MFGRRQMPPAVSPSVFVVAAVVGRQPEATGNPPGPRHAPNLARRPPPHHPSKKYTITINHQHHTPPTPNTTHNITQQKNQPMAVSATLHCLTGCAIGEIPGLIIGTAIGLVIVLTIVLAVGLAFLFGYALSTLPLLKAGLGFGSALRVVLAADTLSILTMEVVDNPVMARPPRRHGRRPGEPRLLGRDDDRPDRRLLRRLPGQPLPVAAREGPRPHPPSSTARTISA